MASQIPRQRTTEIDVSSDLSFDSNIARVSRELAAREGLKLADEIATPDATIILARPLGSTMFFVTGDGGYDFHRVNTIRDHAHITVNGGVGRRLGSCQGAVTGMYGQTQSDLAEFYAVAGNSGVRAESILKNTETRENVSFDATCGRSIGLAPSLTVTQSWLSNSDSLRQYVNNQSLNLTAGLGYQQPAFGVISLFGVYNSASYPNRPTIQTNGSIGDYGYTVYAGGVRYERHVGVKLDVSASLSYTSLSPNGQLSPLGPGSPVSGASRFHGLTYSLDASYHPSSRLTLHVNAGRATNPSNRIDANFSVNDTYQADATYRLGARISLKLEVANKGESYRGLPTTLVNDPLYQYNLLKGSTTQVELSADYMMSRRLTFGFQVGDAERRATPSSFGYSSTTVGVRAKATF